jgi:hypothetical protein
MLSTNHVSSLCTVTNDIHCFLNGAKILKLPEFVSIREDTTAYVIGCFYGVAQGIDFMIDDKKNFKPRFIC